MEDETRIDKLERLMNLTAALLETTRPLSAEELKERIPGYPERQGSFRRQFERDKDDLREMGIPLLIEEVPGSDPPVQGYRIDRRSYYLRDPGFKPDELAALHLATSLVPLEPGSGPAGSPGPASAAIWKLGGAVSDADEPEITHLPSNPALGSLFTAVSERRRATFTYNGTRRTVDPYQLAFQRGRWYLRAFDHLRHQERSFRVDRIDSDVELDRAGSYERPEAHVPGRFAQPWEYGEGDPITARVLVDAPWAPFAAQAAGIAAVREWNDDGAVVLTMQVTNTEAFRSFVLHYLDHAEVLDPPALRDEIVAWLESVP